MSIRPETHDDRAALALDQFDDLLFENPEVCSRCFARIRDRETHDHQGLGTGNKPTETLERAGDGEVGYDLETKDGYGELTATQVRTYCSKCGSPSGRASGDETAPLQTIKRRCDRIVRRLHDQGYYLNISQFYQLVEILKKRPDAQGRDRQILAIAIHLSLVGERPGPGGVLRVDAWTAGQRQ